MKSLEHISYVLFDDRVFVGSEFYFLELLFRHRVIRISKDHVSKCLALLYFNGLEELRPRPSLLLKQLLFFSIFFAELNMLDSIVILEQIRAYKWLPDILEVPMVCPVEEINEI